MSGHSSEGTARVEECGCGLWICRECRPENFDPKHPLNDPETRERGRVLVETAIKQARRFRR